ncbi:cell envelope integrity protein CreD [Pelagibius sp. Alg239-R121]|uniref:cell envelope integrity protein CreD n=1 Tax=Pelagibius sp. Alg239-R121 TaxID=2993448 RepID=UPI0024A76751|nr:cell envelope integrity protein CreD [Pelagibius sp. Alg239-R121]
MNNGQKTTAFLSHHAAVIKIALLGLMVVIMLIPLEYVRSVITERAFLSKSVTHELGESWGRAQTLAGPILLLPIEESYVVKVKSPDYTEEKPLYLDETRWHRRNLYILPDAQKITADLTSQTRKRGIYEALLYTADAKARGSFRIPAAETLPIEEGARVHWAQAKLLVHLSDLRGSANAPTLLWGNEELLFDVRSDKLHQSLPGDLNWIQAPLPKLAPQSAPIDFAFDVKLKGSSALGFIPLGRESNFALTGDWPHPSFSGAQLPVSNEVRDDGFSAQWQISHLARGLPQVLRDDNDGAKILVQQIHRNAVSTRLLNPVDFYRMSERSAKYGLLFIIVTFGTLFVFEAMGKRRLHAVQYLMVGAAVTLFFLLQVSLAEVIGFASAFGLAALACVALVTLYAAKINASRMRGLLLGGLLSGVYGYLFFTLQAEDQAMLMGSLLLLILLATAMYTTRNFDWYALGERLVPQSPAQGNTEQSAGVWGNRKPNTSEPDSTAKL